MDNQEISQPYSGCRAVHPLGSDHGTGPQPAHDTTAIPAEQASMTEPEPDFQRDYTDLLRSFDMIFQLHQRSEDIRIRLDSIHRILLTSRTVAGLTRRVIEALERDFDLVVARILLRQDYFAASLLGSERPANVGILPEYPFQQERWLRSDPFVLDDPTGSLAQILFSETASLISSATVVALGTDSKDLGVLCLGSDDPSRFCGGTNTHLIASLAEKLSLGILNARDHELRAEQAITGAVEGAFTLAFFTQFLHCEFARAKRYGTTFSLAALAWWALPSDDPISDANVAALITENLRSSDLPATADNTKLWILLPETDARAARALLRRLMQVIAHTFLGEVIIHAGVTEFSKGAATASRLLDEALQALEEAQLYQNDPIALRTIPVPSQPLNDPTYPRVTR